MAKYPSNRPPDPDPNQIPTTMRSHLVRHGHETRPKPSMPRLKWLDRKEVGEKQPRGDAGGEPGFDLGEGELVGYPEMDKTHQRRNLAKAQRMDKTGKYTNHVKITLTDEQFALVEQAVKLSGKHFTEWARPRLLAAAEQEIREHRERKLDAAE